MYLIISVYRRCACVCSCVGSESECENKTPLKPQRQSKAAWHSAIWSGWNGWVGAGLDVVGGAWWTVKLERWNSCRWLTAPGVLTLVIEQLVLQFLRPEDIEQLGVVENIFRLLLVQVKLSRVAQLRVFGYWILNQTPFIIYIVLIPYVWHIDSHCCRHLKVKRANRLSLGPLSISVGAVGSNFKTIFIWHF